jgi:hypothetical protein
VLVLQYLRIRGSAYDSVVAFGRRDCVKLIVGIAGGMARMHKVALHCLPGGSE